MKSAERVCWTWKCSSKMDRAGPKSEQVRTNPSDLCAGVIRTILVGCISWCYQVFAEIENYWALHRLAVVVPRTNHVVDIVMKWVLMLINSRPSSNVRCHFHYELLRQRVTSCCLTPNYSVTLPWCWMLWSLAACCLSSTLFLHFSGPCWVRLDQVNLSGSLSSLTLRYVCFWCSCIF